MAILLVLLDAPAYLALALVVFPKIQRYLADLVSSTSRMPHMITAKSKGLSETKLLLWHVVPIIRREVLALAGVSLALAVSAAIPVEALCGVPGIGQLAWQSALARDLPVLVYVSLLVIACTVLANSGADLLADERRELS
jgi:peptide/nickel transport system permease protein